MQVDRNLSGDMRMEFGLDKCEETVLKREKLVRSHNSMLDCRREIQELEQRKPHKYLETEESEGIHLQQMK
jgi:hypothetical protein